MNEVFRRISYLHSDAKIIITTIQQDYAIISMFKYHIKNNLTGVKTIEEWTHTTNIGMYYLSVCIYGDLAQLLLPYFKKQNIYFLFFEDLKTQSALFYNELYDILGLPFKTDLKSRPKNTMNLLENQLYLLLRLNLRSLKKASSEHKFSSKKNLFL